MNGSLRVAGLVLATVVTTTAVASAVPSAAVADVAAPRTARSIDPDRGLTYLLARFSNLGPVRRLGALGKMGSNRPGVAAALNRIQNLKVMDLLDSSAPDSPDHPTVSVLKEDREYQAALATFKAQPQYKLAQAIMQQSVNRVV
ncbi:hypothetical protein ACGFNU_34555 [Spirillospora sp. NPDC048911]|uniref:hypothetical protein n=1 Tax=Spirillospora sp. NPDC048911 TaxID=3364527 RepID=UPI0037139F07